MSKAFNKDSETFQAIDKYLRDSLNKRLVTLQYVGIHSSNGLTPIVHYDIEYRTAGAGKPPKVTPKARITVHWNNDVPSNVLPAITQMDLMEVG